MSSKGTNPVLIVIASALLALGLTGASYSQPPAGRAGGGPAAASKDASVFNEYRGVKIGMAATDVRAKIGASKEKTQSDTQDQYIFADGESVLFYYDAAHAVNAIMITFQG